MPAVHTAAHAFTYAIAYTVTNPLAYAIAYAVTYAVTNPLAYAITHSIPYAVTHRRAFSDSDAGNGGHRSGSLGRFLVTARFRHGWHPLLH